MLSEAPTIVALHPPPYLKCPLCLDAWKDPVEFVVCGHIVCWSCLEASGRAYCPACRNPEATETRKPSLALVRMADDITVHCEGCSWTGTRKSSKGHRCFAVPRGDSSVRKHQAAHAVTDELVSSMATYFLAFGGEAHDDPKAVALEREGFYQLLRCFNYAESSADMDMVFDAVLKLSLPASGGSRKLVTVGGLCAFLAQYPADPRRMYRLSPTQYHTCMYQLWLWYNSEEGMCFEKKMSPEQFLAFAVRYNYVKAPKDKVEEQMFLKHWMRLVDVVDNDGTVCQHEALRFMSCCIRGVSMSEENLSEGLDKNGPQRAGCASPAAGLSPRNSSANDGGAANRQKGTQQPSGGNANPKKKQGCCALM